MGSTGESYLHKEYEPKDYFLTETYVESLTESTTEQRFPEQRFFEDVDYDDAAVEEMLREAHPEHVHHSQRECLSVGQWWSSVSGLFETERGSKSSPTVRLRSENTTSKLIMTDEVYKILSVSIESQQKELHRAQAGERRRRDQQLLNEQLLKQNWELREAHEKGFNDMEELKRFHNCKKKMVEDQDTVIELTGKILDCKMKSIVQMIQEILKMLNQFAVDIPTLPVNLCLSRLIKFLVEC